MVLALIVVSFAFAATASDATWTTGVLVVLQGLTLIAAIWTSGLARTRSWLVFGLAMLTIAIALAVVSSAAGGADLTGAVGLVSALFIICVVVVIVRSIAWSPEVNAEIILGAICVYVSIGMIFLFAYGAVADIGSSALLRPGRGRHPGAPPVLQLRHARDPRLRRTTPQRRTSGTCSPWSRPCWDSSTSSRGRTARRPPQGPPREAQ